MGKFYITTPLYYVNAAPHVGHAYTNIISDCMARYKRLAGEEVFFLTGTDEYGEKIKEAAQNKAEDIQLFVDRVMKNFENLWKELNISYDFFIRTTQKAHRQVVQKVITDLNEKGDIYKAKYHSFYCVPCESFWTDTQIKDGQGKCPLCKREVEEIEEENYFFRLSKYEEWLKKYLKDNPQFIKPKIRYNEAKGFLDNNPLVDLCISRPKSRVSWGIEFPLDADYVVYVWFDALLNYICAKEWYGIHPQELKKWWPADIQFIGKDILRHHAIFWPIMLHALGLEPPHSIFAHGWWKFEGEKMSKSKGNIVNPLDLIKEIGVDALRYFLLREVSVGMDGNFSWEAIVNRINSDLANDLGNLVYRTLNMTEKYFGGVVSSMQCKVPTEFNEAFISLMENYKGLMDECKFSLALEEIFKLIGAMNKYIEDKKPWVLWKDKKEQELKEFLYSLLEGIRIVSLHLSPFIPQTSQSINRQLGLKAGDLSLGDREWSIKGNFNTKKESPLFPRIDVD